MKLSIPEKLRFWARKEASDPGADENKPVLDVSSAVHPDDDPVIKLLHGAVKFAQIGCLLFLLLFCANYVGKVRFEVDFNAASHSPLSLTYDASASLNLLALVPLVFVALGILKFSKSWVSFFCETPKDDLASRWGIALLGIGATFVIVAGSMDTNQETKQEDYRSTLIAEEKLDNAAAGQQAIIEEKKERLKKMQTGDTVEAQAATEGAVAWAEKIQIAKAQYQAGEITQGRYSRIERALTQAKVADQLSNDILNSIGAAAVATPKSAVSDVKLSDPTSTFVHGTSPWRMPVMAGVMDCILIFGPHLAMQRRKRLMAEWIDAKRKEALNAEKEQSDTSSGADSETIQELEPTQEPETVPEPESEPEQIPEPDEASTNTETPPETVADTKPDPEEGIPVKGHTRKRVTQRKLRPATLDELKATGWIKSEIENETAEPQGNEASGELDQGGLDDSIPGGDSPADGAGGDQDATEDPAPDLTDEPDVDDAQVEGTDTGAENQADAETEQKEAVA